MTVVPLRKTGRYAAPRHAEPAELSATTLGIYPQMTGAAADKAKVLATSVPAASKEFVINWLQEDYGVSLQ